MADFRLDLQAGTTRLGGVSVEGIEIRHRDRTRIELAGVSHPELGVIGDVLANCRAGSVPRCVAGTLAWRPPDGAALEWRFERLTDTLQLDSEDIGNVRIQWADTSSFALAFQDFELSSLPNAIRRTAGLSALGGRLDSAIEHTAEASRAQLAVQELEFDTPDGRFAGAGLTFDLDLHGRLSRGDLRAEGHWTAGELLLGPAYLPPPVHPVSIDLEAARVKDSVWRVKRAGLNGPDLLDVGISGKLNFIDAVAIDALDIELAYAKLESLWRQGLQSLAAAQGWGQLQPGGRLKGRLRIENNALAGFGLRLAESTVEDAAGRLDLKGLGAWAEWDTTTGSLAARASWTDARLFRIPLGAAAFELASREDGTLALVEPFRLPVLDGALVLERLVWRDWLNAERQLDLDARLEPVDLARLSSILGWTEFSGSISGRFPGIRFAGNAIDVQGGLDLDLFDGQARIEHLSIERPFGSLPALAADVEFDSLDLEQVTGAFEFGRMLGLLSGHVRDLRLLDWQPVRFDAWFETLENSPRRRISQKAVDSISTISGGGGAALSGTLLNFFEDFPYRKAGLGCLLENNICRMHGLRETEQGGYMILEGRALPRLDIVGYKRRVDWPRLLLQIAAATGPAE